MSEVSDETQRFKALKSAKDALERLDFFANDKPKCPHCASDFDIAENGCWRLYEEGEHEITCGDCGEDFTVSTRVSYTFSTDNADTDED